MSTAPSVTVLLAELNHLGIRLEATDGRLRYRPRSCVTPDLRVRLELHKAELLSALVLARQPAANWTSKEQELIRGCSARAVDHVEIVKRTFASSGGAQGVGVCPFKSEARDQAARLIREARRNGNDDGLAVALRDAWRERLAICTAAGDVSLRAAEAVALDELESMLAVRQG